MQLIVELPDELRGELEAVARENRISPLTWATEALWSVLATRRLPRVKPSVQCGRHNGASEGRDAEHGDYEPEPYSLHCRIDGVEI